MNNEFKHYGVIGMKWGVRKGTLSRTTKSGHSLTLSHVPPPKITQFAAKHIPALKKSVDNTANYSLKDKKGNTVGDLTLYKESKDSLNVVWVSTKKSEQGKGYGTAAMKAVIDIAKETGSKKVTLEVPGDSPDAKHIYEKLGFKSLPTPDFDADDIWGGLTNMELDLTKSLKHRDPVDFDTEKLLDKLAENIDTMDSEDDENRKEMSALKHSETVNKIFADAKKMGSLKDSYLAHADDYGVEDIEQLFPNAKSVGNKPRFINNNVAWVNKVLGGVNQLPFSRVKSLFADITSESIRAKGYVKGSLKEEDVFGLIKRTTEPYTIYKKGKLDRDDIIDITDFDVVSWIKESMRMKLDEEIARAILIGDGRTAVDNEKIDEECIRPIYNDSDLYTIKMAIDSAETNKYKAFIKAVVKARKDYRGSGSPTLYTTEDLIAELLLLEDTTGRGLYSGIEELKSILRVSDIVAISEMVDLVRDTTDGKDHNVMGIIVNVRDYSVGSDKGGKVSMFDDFDIDYNNQKYLIETRCSGALTVPYSAMVIEDVVTPPAPPAPPTTPTDPGE